MLRSLRDREQVLGLLADLPSTPVATHAETLRFVEANHLYGEGLSPVDAHLLASVVLAPGTQLWTRDERLMAAARRLGVGRV